MNKKKKLGYFCQNDRLKKIAQEASTATVGSTATHALGVEDSSGDGLEKKDVTVPVSVENPLTR